LLPQTVLDLEFFVVHDPFVVRCGFGGDRLRAPGAERLRIGLAQLLLSDALEFALDRGKLRVQSAHQPGDSGARSGLARLGMAGT